MIRTTTPTATPAAPERYLRGPSGRSRGSFSRTGRDPACSLPAGRNARCTTTGGGTRALAAATRGAAPLHPPTLPPGPVPPPAAAGPRPARPAEGRRAEQGARGRARTQAAQAVARARRYDALGRGSRRSGALAFRPFPPPELERCVYSFV